MKGATLVVRDRIVTVLREHGFLTTADLAHHAGWVLDSVSHMPDHPLGVVGFYHTFQRPDLFQLLACDGKRCLLSRNLAGWNQVVLRNCNALERQGVLCKVKTPGVQAVAWVLNNRGDLLAADRLEALWTAPARRLQ